MTALQPVGRLTATLLRGIRPWVLFAFAICCAAPAGSVQGATTFLKFEGVVDGAFAETGTIEFLGVTDFELNVEAGDTFMACLTVDTSVAENPLGPGESDYPEALIQMDVEFSSGVTLNFEQVASPTSFESSFVEARDASAGSGIDYLNFFASSVGLTSNNPELTEVILLDPPIFSVELQSDSGEGIATSQLDSMFPIDFDQDFSSGSFFFGFELVSISGTITSQVPEPSGVAVMALVMAAASCRRWSRH